MKVFVNDIDRCEGCYMCQMSCKDEHVGNDWTPYAKPQPEWGQFWGKLYDYTRGNSPQVTTSFVFVPCQHCENASCIDSCIVGAISTRDDGFVWIDPKKCTGCQLCVDSCPYDCIFYNTNMHLAQKCTGCAHLMDRSDWSYGPRCADICYQEALKYGEESDFDLSNAETLHPEYGLNTKVRYIGLPETHRFIGGTVFTSSDEEVVIGATCTLTGEGQSYTAATDEFGDFWFKDLPTGGTYSLAIESSSGSKTISDISLTKDIGLGDIAID
ncbi:MAG: 4Fe-4S dicluster domain-containing protein [Eubacteriales bacterium]